MMPINMPMGGMPMGGMPMPMNMPMGGMPMRGFQPRQKSNSAMIIIIVIVFLLFIGGGTAVYLMSQKSNNTQQTQTPTQPSTQQFQPTTQAPTQQSQPITQTTQPAQTTQPPPPESPYAQIFENNFTYQNDPTPGRDGSGLVWTKGCDRPWNAKYKIGCEKNGIVKEWTKELGPASTWGWQGPKIRIGPDGNTTCADEGGLVKIQRSRYGGPWEDITNNVKDFNAVDAYDRKKGRFYDNYNMDC